MNYREALAYINSFTDYEKLASVKIEPIGLERIQRLLGILGSPHLRGTVFHVAGTKGKGSTAAMVASILRAQGYRTGLFTSPHLHSFRERIRIDGVPVSETELAALAARVQPLIEEMHREGSLGRITTFEVTAVLAFICFDVAGADLRVIEVGLGGRLDATNVVRPLVSIITPISLDHTSILGPTLRQVAQEKAGIIKPGGLAVSAPQEREAEEVIRETCRAQGARLVMLGKDVTWHRQHASLEGQTVLVTTRRGKHELRVPFLGRFQCENAALAVAAIEEARDLGIEVSPDSIGEGLSSVSWPGRMQVLRRAPLLLVDGAHNTHSAGVLRDAVREDLRFERCILVVGTSVDKDIAGIARELAPLADIVIATRSRHPRSATCERVAAEFASLGRETVSLPQVPSALARALGLASPADLVLVTGSLFVVAEALEWAGQDGAPSGET